MSDKTTKGEENPQKPIVIVQNRKSAGLAFILTFFFGPLGMLYSTVIGGVIMFLIDIVVGIFTLGLGFLITWPIQIIWAIVAVNNHNNRQQMQVQQQLKSKR